MKESSQSLFHSLVGSSIEFSCKKKYDGSVPLEKTLASSRKRIEKDVQTALDCGGKLCVVLLAELTSYFSKQNYYMMIRSSIRMNRYRLQVLDYLNLSIEERAENLKKLLSEKIKGDKFRDLKISALKYFLSTYTGRISEFKSLITKEEFLIIV